MSVTALAAANSRITLNSSVQKDQCSKIFEIDFRKNLSEALRFHKILNFPKKENFRSKFHEVQVLGKIVDKIWVVRFLNFAEIVEEVRKL